MKVYDLPEVYRKIDEALDETLGVFTPEIEEMVRQADENKVSAYTQLVNMIEEAEFTSSAIAEKIKALQERKKSFEARKDNIRKFILNSMISTGTDKIELPAGGKISVKKLPASVVIDDATEIPNQYKKAEITIPADKLEELEFIGIPILKQELVIDKKAIMDANKKDIGIAGTHIKDDGITLMIK